jgi:membrane-bound lytic murein transglycosylase D
MLSFRIYVVIFTVAALCMLPGRVLSNTAMESAGARASEILILFPEPEPAPVKKEAALAAEPEPQAEGFEDILEGIRQGPRLITVSQNDKRAHLAIRESLRIFTKTIRQRFAMWLERSGRYMEVMHEVLKERNMPPELVFLPIVESGYNPHAYSKARAAGPWQFIAETGKRYGLVIDWWRDERRDPVKSTVAASKYLSELHSMFGSWSLALAAYNAGEGRIARAVRKTNGGDFWKIHSGGQIAQETRDYVPRFIAASMIARDPEKYGFNDLEYHEPFEYDEVELYQPVDLDVAARLADTTLERIKGLNPELRRWSTPPNLKKYTLRVPPGKADIFVERISAMPDGRLFSCDRYVVKKRDNIRTIAARAKAPVNVIMDLNSLRRVEKLKPGVALRVPPRGKFVADLDDRMTALESARERALNNNFTLMGSVVQMNGPAKDRNNIAQKASLEKKGRKTGKSVR